MDTVPAPADPPDAALPRPRLDPREVERKLARFFELCELAKEAALEGIRHQHPQADKAEQYRLLAERLAIFREGKWRGCR